MNSTGGGPRVLDADALDGTTAGTVFARVRDECFISIWNPKRMRGACVLLQHLAVDAWLDQIQSQCGPFSDCELKAICKEQSAWLLQLRSCKVLGFKSVKWAPVVTAAEVFWNSESGVIRFAEEVKKSKSRVLVVDDSATIRKLLRSVIEQDSELEVIAEAAHPSQVESLVQQFKPDVMTLDIHMPDEDGVSLLSRLFPKYRVPTVMITSVGLAEGNLVLKALELGAVDYIQKPSLQELSLVSAVITEKIRVAAHAKLKPLESLMKRASLTREPDLLDFDRIFAFGASTGGTEALRNVLMSFPKHIPPVLVVQHIPAVFSTAFAKRLNELCPFEVKEAEDGDTVVPNQVLIAPGGKQMKLVRGRQGEWLVKINDDAPVNRHQPSVDYLFESIAKAGAKKVTAALLTGMGTDGARGLLQLKNNGALTLAQDEATSVVYGMPRAAVLLQAAQQVLPLQDIGAAMITSAQPLHRVKQG